MDSIEVQVCNPRTGRIDYRFRQTGAEEIARLATTMRDAQQQWNDSGADNRCQALLELAAAISKRHDEIFNAFRTDQEAIDLANDTIYGLSAAVFANDVQRARKIAARLDAGGICINDAGLTSVVHEGEKQAFKSSGMGGSRMGPASIRRFLRTKALIENTQTAWDP